MMGRKHEKWMAQYGRVYKDEAEKGRRFEIFRENVELSSLSIRLELVVLTA